MFLEKWYGDFVSNGRAQIWYLANLHFGPLTLGYQGNLGAGRASKTVLDFRGFEMPTVRGESLYWPASIDQTEIIWKGVCRRPQWLWQQGKQAVLWEPVVLNGEMSIVQEQQEVRGYAERLTLNFMPWRLGLKTLKWGRFCGRKHSLVWIEWCGRIQKKLALLDGHATAWLTVGERSVRTEQARLSIETPHQIVSEALGIGALHPFDWLRVFEIAQFLSGVETKWFTEGILELDGAEVEQGSVLYEEVIWP
ncbi:MAG: hypothetical protein WAU60_07220 [Candidatus Competibacter denitrificans]|jgi:hypothetical protein